MQRFAHRSSFPLSRLALVLLFFGLSFLVSKSFAQTIQIDPLKANYIQGFLDFVRWDGEVKKDTVTIGIMGDSGLFNHLQRNAAAKTTGRRINVKNVSPSGDVSELDVLYITTAGYHDWSVLTNKCRQHQILLIGEESGFTKAGGCIEFTLKRNRLRFFVNERNASLYGIDISSKLMELALPPE